VNSVTDLFRVVLKRRPFLQNHQGAGARKRFLPLSWATGLKAAQYYSYVFLFLFTLEPK
jgi:hypothetical protein